MRTALTLVLLFTLAFLHATPDAHARRRGKTRPAGDGPYAIAVAPFDGDGAGGRTISEALELELELIETVLVKGDRWLRSDLRRAGDAGYEPATLRRIMKKRKVDILVRGRRAGQGVEVLVYGADGKPRFVESFPLPDDPDESAREMVEQMRPVLLRWPRAKVVEPPSDAPAVVRRPAAPEPEPEEEEPAPRVDEDDLFVDFEDEDAPEVRDSALPEPDPMPEGEGDGEPAPDPVPDEERPRRALADEPDEEEKKPKRRRLLLDESSGDDDEGRRPLLSGDDEEELERPRVTMADVEDEAGKAPLLHWVAVSVGGVGGGWYYEFAAAKDPEDDFTHTLWDYGGQAHVSFWPIEYAGLDATVGARTFSVNAEGLPVVPNQLRVLGLTAAASARARYPFKLGNLAFAPGVRAGYRYWGSSVDPQTHAEDERAFTLIPGWQLHAVSIGAELFASYVVEKWRFEGELHVEPLPLMRYEETPDNPAVYARPFGGNGTLILRIPVYAPVFIEVHGSTTLAFVTWEGGPGTRLSQTRKDGSGNRLRVDGGQSLNVQFGGGLSVGAAF